MTQPDQGTIEQIEELQRLDTIRDKQRSVRDIVETYVGGISLISAAFVTSKNRQATTDAEINGLMIEVDQAIRATYNPMYDSFEKNLNNVGDLAGRHFQTSMTAGGLILPKDYENTISIIANNTTLDGIGGGFKISERIWDVDKRAQVLGIIKQDRLNGVNPFETAQKIEQFGTEGTGFKQAHRLAYTESTRAYAKADNAHVNNWNADPGRGFDIMVEQYLSITHGLYDICDILAGRYESAFAPEIPRHPHCNCGQRKVIVPRGSRKGVTTISKQVETNNKQPEKIKVKPQEVRTFKDAEIG